MLQIVRVAGIPVRIDASWLLVFALIWQAARAGAATHGTSGRLARLGAAAGRRAA
jgi:Zn-dependent protease